MAAQEKAAAGAGAGMASLAGAMRATMRPLCAPLANPLTASQQVKLTAKCYALSPHLTVCTAESLLHHMPKLNGAILLLRLLQRLLYTESKILLQQASEIIAGCADMAAALAAGMVSQEVLQRYLAMSDSLLAPLMRMG